MATKKKAAKAVKAPKVAKTKKSAVAKPKAAKKNGAAKKPHTGKPHTGQSGSKHAVALEKLNPKERKVIKILSDDLNPIPLNSLAAACWPDLKVSQANSWVRNALRRLVCSSWVEKVGRGTYRLAADKRASLGVTHVESDSKEAVVATASA